METIIKIIPARKMPFGKESFDYSLPVNEVLPAIGSLVKIPLGKRESAGIVFAVDSKSEFANLKSIVPSSGWGILPKYYLELLVWFSSFYHYSLPSAVDMVLPLIPKRLKTKQATESLIHLPLITEVDGKAQEIFSSKVKKFLLFPNDNLLKIKFYHSLARLTAVSKEQCLILFPQKQLLNDFVATLPKDLQSRTLVLTGDMHSKKLNYFDIWQRALRGEYSLILGTRSTIFCPLYQPRLIIIDESENEDYKQSDQTPRYNTVTVAKKISQLTGAQLILSGLTPSIEDAFEAKKEKYQFIRLGQDMKKEIELCDLLGEREKTFTYLGERLLTELAQNHEARKMSLLIVNKQGEYSYLLCNDCGYKAECPHCQQVLVVNDKQLQCRRCRYLEPLPLLCPKCHGTKLKMLGIGLAQIQKKLVTLGYTALEFNDAEPFKKAEIILATGKNLPRALVEKMDLIAFVYIDNLVYLADFRANYKVYNFVRNLVDKANLKSKIILQTAFASNEALQKTKTSYAEFYKTEIEARESFAYPPFRQVIKIFFDHHDEKICEREAYALFSQLKPKVSELGGQMMDPYRHYLTKVRKRFRYQIVFFWPLNSKPEQTELWKLIPDYWHIDREPKDLL